MSGRFYLFCGRTIDYQSETSADQLDAIIGWPSFCDAQSDTVILREDRTHGVVRTEVLCGSCRSHVGHVFDGEGYTPTGQRYRINSISLKLEPKGDGETDHANPAQTPT
jgi:peptide-methionine (R)-S-oxide reductase